MADPFEVRMRFSSQLQHLNASVTSAQKAASYALKYKDMDEDLHSCILEQLERVCNMHTRPHSNLQNIGLTHPQNNMNTRANIMYFIEPFLEMAQKDGHIDYVRMIQRDIIRVVDAVAPDDGSGAANVKVVRRVRTKHAWPLLIVPSTDTRHRSFKVSNLSLSSSPRPSSKSTKSCASVRPPAWMP